MSKEYIPLFLDFNETTQDLTDEECGRLVRAIVDYANGNDCEARLTGGERIAFRFMRGAIDRNQAISQVRAKAGASRNKSNQNGANGNKPEQNETKSLTKTKTKTKNNNKNKEENEREKEPRSRFTPPTVAEVADYCKERGNGINPEYFVDYYARQDWYLSNGKKIKDWKACVRTWENRDKERGNRGNPANIQRMPTLAAQNYSQRDYSSAEESTDDVITRLRAQKA